MAVALATVMPIVKANAYGQGLVELTRHLVALSATSLGVAPLKKAVMLRDAGLTVPILVKGGTLGNQIPVLLRHDLTLTVSSIDKLRHIDETARDMGVTAKVHLKIDMGMGGSVPTTTTRKACSSARRSAGTPSSKAPTRTSRRFILGIGASNPRVHRDARRSLARAARGVARDH